MTSQQLRRAQLVFEEALDLGDDERAAFLDERCASDLDLRRAVDSLLSSDAAPDVFLEEPLVRPTPADALDELANAYESELAPRTRGMSRATLLSALALLALAAVALWRWWP